MLCFFVNSADKTAQKLRTFFGDDVSTAAFWTCFLNVIVMLSSRGEGGNKHCFGPSVCHPSFCLSIAYIMNNSRTQRPSVPKFGRFLTLDATRIPVSRSDGPLILTHIMGHFFQMARPPNFRLWIRMEDNSHQPQTPWPPRLKVKVV